MKTLGIYKFDKKLYGNLIDRLKELDIEVKPLADGEVSDEVDLYAFDMDNPKEFENIKFDRPFIIISSINDKKYLIKSLKSGALDFISKPFTDIDVTVKRIHRIIEKGSGSGVQNKSVQNEKYDKLIEIEIKRAHRGKYPMTIASVNFDVKLGKETIIRLIDRMKTVLRDSDSCIPYSDQKVIILLPFADKPGSAVVARKLTEVLSGLSYKNFCLCATYPEDGENLQELMNNLGKGFDSRNLYK